MEHNQKGQEPGQQQQASGEQNPTLNKAGSSVADYGNVMGGSSDENVQQGQNNDSSQQDAEETAGIP